MALQPRLTAAGAKEKEYISVSYRSGKKVGAAPTTKERFCRQNTNMAVPILSDPKDVNYLFGFKRNPTNSRCHIFTDILIFGYSSGRMKWTQLLHRRSQRGLRLPFIPGPGSTDTHDTAVITRRPLRCCRPERGDPHAGSPISR